MKTLRQLCKPRNSVFDSSRRDGVLDLTDLIEKKINPETFFDENYLTNGMRRLLKEAFQRFADNSPQGVFVLTQAMGGGKTHNMIALGLLAQYPNLRKQVLGDHYNQSALEKVRVVAFTGRESDAPLGVWGAIASQLNKKEVFNEYYSPLSAPGQTAWMNLLRGEPLLILLDELPPYLENARSRTIGNSDLARVTTTALSNLLVAVGKNELSNVCVVISDLKATYESGSEQINKALEDLKSELGRGALTLEPVGLNTDEIYHILRKRLFEELPSEEEKWEIARAYAQSVRDAKQMDITKASPDKFASQLKESYPFHFAIKDLYARFRENAGFQQTRGLIRLMRVMVARVFDEETGKADTNYLIHAHDLDLNDAETLAEIAQINPTLDNAISHDIASNGQAIAENIDHNLGDSNAQDASKLILISSLANVPGAIKGLSMSEIVSYLCAPKRDVTRLPQDILATLLTTAWYLYSNNEGKLYFKNVQNLIARLKTTADGYSRKSSLKELRSFLFSAFAPSIRDCYQEILVLPPIDEINIRPDKVTLVIYEPNQGGGLHPDLHKFYEDLDYKNRVFFLSGTRGTLDTLLECTANLKAIKSIVVDLDVEKVADNDPQRIAADDIQDKVKFRLLSVIRETFTTLTYPHVDRLVDAHFPMNFTGNNFDGEKQIRETLRTKQKFTDDITSNSFRKKCEIRLLTQKTMLWTEVKRRAAMFPIWQWHRMDALDILKNDLIYKDQWRENGGYIEKPPFPKPETSVRVQQMQRNENTGETILKLTSIYGDIIYFEIGSAATTASLSVTDPTCFVTSELNVSFLCVDTKGEHKTGDPLTWQNSITLKHRVYQNGTDKMIEIQTAPLVPTRYTTDGSDPKVAGGLYDGPFVVIPGTVCVLAVGQCRGISSNTYRIDISWDKKEEFEIDINRPATWIKKHKLDITKETYDFLARVKKYQVAVVAPTIGITSQPHWLELTFDDKLQIEIEQLEDTINYLRGFLAEGQVSINVNELQFTTGQRLLDWVAEVKAEIKPKEIKQ